MHKFRFYFLLFLTLLLKSCEVLDVQLFTKATSEMGTAIDAGLKQVVADLKKVKIPDASTNDLKKRQDQVKERQERFAKDITDLETHTKAFTKVAHAFDAYAQALDEVAASGKKQGDQVEKVAKTLLDLAAATKAYTGAVGVVAPAAIGLLDIAIQDWVKLHTINSLSKLISPKQDTLVQRTARVLRLGLQDFGRIDSDAFGLVEDYKLQEDVDLTNLYQNALSTKKVAISRLGLVKLIENNLLDDKKLQAGKIEDLKANLRSLIAQDKWLDKNNLLETKLNVLLADTKVQPSSIAALSDALGQRKVFYTGWLNEPQLTQVLYEAEQARYAQNTDVVDKSQKAIIAWASVHHTLRAELLKSRRVKTADFIRYGQASQKLVDAVKSLKNK